VCNTIAIFIPKITKIFNYQFLESNDIFVLEGQALLKALEIIEKEKIKSPLIFSDNRALLNQIKHPTYILHQKSKTPLLINTIRNLIKPDYKIQWIPGHSQIIKHIITDNIASNTIPKVSIENASIEIEEAYKISLMHTMIYGIEIGLPKKEILNI